MDAIIKSKLSNVLKGECTYIMNNEKDIQVKASKMDTLFNLQKIIDNYDELEPLLKEYFTQKAEKIKWDRSER